MKDKKLVEALRQYKHNDNSGFVAGYDIATIDSYVEDLNLVVDELKKAMCIYAREELSHIVDDYSDTPGNDVIAWFISYSREFD